MPNHRKHSKPADESRMPYFPWQLWPRLGTFTKNRRFVEGKNIPDDFDGSHLPKSKSRLRYTLKKTEDNEIWAVLPKFSLGRGRYGNAKVVQNVRTGELAVMKVQPNLAESFDEQQALKKLNLLEGSAVRAVDENKSSTKSRHYIIMPLAPGIPFLNFLQDHTITYGQWLRLAHNLLFAYKTQISDRGYTHNDIHSKNIIIDPVTFECTFIDLGYSKKEEKKFVNNFDLSKSYNDGEDFSGYFFSLTDFPRLIAILYFVTIKFDFFTMEERKFNQTFFGDTHNFTVEQYLALIKSEDIKYNELHSKDKLILKKIKIGILNLDEYHLANTEVKAEMVERLKTKDQVWFLDPDHQRTTEQYVEKRIELERQGVKIGNRILHCSPEALSAAVARGEYKPGSAKKADEEIEVVGNHLRLNFTEAFKKFLGVQELDNDDLIFNCDNLFRLFYNFLNGNQNIQILDTKTSTVEQIRFLLFSCFNESDKLNLSSKEIYPYLGKWLVFLNQHVLPTMLKQNFTATAKISLIQDRLKSYQTTLSPQTDNIAEAKKTKITALLTALTDQSKSPTEKLESFSDGFADMKACFAKVRRTSNNCLSAIPHLVKTALHKIGLFKTDGARVSNELEKIQNTDFTSVTPMY